MNAFQRTFVLFTLFLSFVTHAEDENKAKEKVELCKKLITEHCGASSFKECAKKEDPKTAKVGECVNYLARHRKMFNIEDLNPDFQTLLNDFSKPGEDGKKCIETARVVCGEGVDLKGCLSQYASSFPSYCRDFAEKRVHKAQAAYDNDPELKNCAENLMKQCKADFGAPDDPNGKVIMAGMAKYEACLMKAMAKTRGCDNLVKMDKRTPPSKSVQLLTQ